MGKTFKGFTKIFSFTFRQQTGGKKFRISFLLIALLCLVLPAVIMSALEAGSSQEPKVTATEVKFVEVVDSDTEHPADYGILNETGDEVFSNIIYESCESLEEAIKATQDKAALILLVDGEMGEYKLQVLTPDGSALSLEEADHYDSFLDANFSAVLMMKSGLTMEQMEVIQGPVQTEILSAEGEGIADMQFEQLKSVLSFILPYLVIMLLYFMILFYGQGVANSVIQEKSSKLMDNLLLSVNPAALVMGKVLAIFLAGVMQVLVWVGCLVGGFAIGTACVKAMNPATDMLIIRFFDSLNLFSGIFNIGGILFALGIFLAGFLLYCSISAIGGSLASKQEDLGTTNMMFTMILVVSFMATMFGGALEGDMAGWMIYLPFTAVLVGPGEALLGNMSIFQSCLSLGIMLITVVIFIWLAGKIYSLMVLYKGNPPTPGKIIKMLTKK